VRRDGSSGGRGSGRAGIPRLTRLAGRLALQPLAATNPRQEISKQTSPAAANAPPEDHPFLPISGALLCLLVTRPQLIAHRGASAEAPENTLAAFRRALALGVDGIELDVQVSRDGVPVVFHDATLVRLTGCRGRIAQFTRRELRRFRVRGEPIPTLAEVLALTRARVVVQVEIKRGVPVAPVVQSIRRARAATGVVLASFEPAQLAAVRALAPRIPRMLIHRGGGGGRATPIARARALAGVLANLGAGGVSLDYRRLRSAAFIGALKRRGFCVWCWTVNDSRAMLRCAAWGADAILSDNPARWRSTFLAPSPVDPAGDRVPKSTI
jgi:glycerophosphoryl diester phosphodiesterase